MSRLTAYHLDRVGCRKTLLGKQFGLCPGGMAQWSPHLPEEQKIRVQIPPGCKVFRENAVVYTCNGLICIIGYMYIGK
jgi:hypothetical protein